MSITGVSGTDSSTAAAYTQPTAATTMGELDRDAFLKLLVAQLRYQDPTKPLDPTEIVSQTSQLTVVDKLAEIATALEQSSNLDRLALAGSIIGREITFTGPEGDQLSAVVASARFDDGSLVLRAGAYDVPLEAVQVVGGTGSVSPSA